VNVVDTVGAGDSFDAGLLFGYLNSWSVERSLRLACICGALSTQNAGRHGWSASLSWKPPNMYLDEIVQAQKLGGSQGTHIDLFKPIPGCLRVAMKHNPGYLLIEATCNQVNQFGGYTGMKPADFVQHVRGIAEASNFPFKNIILGGDHLGPHVWRNESADSAMRKATAMMKDYVQAGFCQNPP